MATGQQFMYGHYVHYEQGEDTEHGLKYLNELDPSVTKTYLDSAKMHGATNFEDQHGRQFLLEFHHDDQTFHLTPK